VRKVAVAALEIVPLEESADPAGDLDAEMGELFALSERSGGRVSADCSFTHCSYPIITCF
jgi:hypothetical protein